MANITEARTPPMLSLAFRTFEFLVYHLLTSSWTA